MKTNKKGISLIVLVITIIVLAILATTVIITVTGDNTNIISKASKTMFKSDMLSYKEALELYKSNEFIQNNQFSETSLNVKYSETEKFEKIFGNVPEKYNSLEVINGELKFNPDDTEHIDVLEELDMIKVVTAEEMIEKYTINYYSTLNGAIEDVNAKTIGTNADAVQGNAEVGVFIDNKGNTNVVLLKNAESAVDINITSNVLFNLGGKTLSFTAAGAELNITTASEVTINGELANSEITKNIQDGANEKLVSATTTALTLNGGTYSMYGKYATACIPIRTESTDTKLSMDGCNVIANNTGAGEARGTQLKGTITVNACSFTTTGQAVCMGVYLANNSANAIITDCIVSVRSSGLGSRNNGVYVGTNSNCEIINCNVTADYPGKDSNGEGYCVALNCVANATTTIYGGHYKAADRTLDGVGNFVIYDGMFEGCEYVALFGGNAIARGATFRNVSYWGDYGWNGTYKYALCCGSSNSAGTVYLDNCRIETEEGHSAGNGIGATYTGTNVYISNTVVDGNFSDYDLCVNTNTAMYIGKNVEYNEDKCLKKGTFDTETYADTEFPLD